MALTLIILLAVVYLGYELTETRKENRALVEQLLQARQQGGSEQGQEAPTLRVRSKTRSSSMLDLFRSAFCQ